MENECCVIDWTSGKPVQCKKSAIAFCYCWEHMPQWYKDALNIIKREGKYYKNGVELEPVASDIPTA